MLARRQNRMNITEWIFLISILVVIYTYFGYGILVYIINKLPALKKIIPKPVNKKSEKIIEENYEPNVSLIISASGERRKIIKEKLENTFALNYPSSKLEVLFAIAYDSSSETDETLDEYYNNFLPESVESGLNSKDEELYIKFFYMDNVEDRNKLSESIKEQLNSIEFNSSEISPNAKRILDKKRESSESEVKILITKDIVRKGKIAQVNRTIKRAGGDILVFSDANSMFNKDSIRNIVRHFRNSQVGCVAGEKKVVVSDDSTSGESEGLYWKYESFLKKMDSKIYSAIGAAGEIFAVRKELMDRDINEKAIIEDFVVSMKIAMDGYRIVYEPEAYAEEEPTKDLKSEYIRKRRITAGGFQSIIWLKELLNPFRYGVLSFQYISHRVLRWAVVPFLLPVILFINMLLLDLSNPVYLLLFWCQIVFYLLTLIGLVLESKEIKIKIFNIPLYFSMMNFAAVVGLKRYLKAQQSVVWEKVSR